jgi:glyoxylase-like metal-dependent hydrolase (beta-lactamase superfamily II)
MALEPQRHLDAPATVGLYRLSGGFLHLPMELFVLGSDSTDVRRVPSMSWLIEHRPSNKKVLFDLGLRKDIQRYPPAVFHRLQTVVRSEVPEDVFDSLKKLHIDPLSAVDAVIFSHLHYDHVGDPEIFGSKTRFVLGPGAKELIAGPMSFPADQHSHYDSGLLPSDRIFDLPPLESRENWVPFGPFHETYDYFGDNSLRIINAPGHCPGHINVLLRLDQNKWVYLGGDTAHDPRILRGEAQTAVYRDENIGTFKCAHHDKEAAEKHIQRVRELNQTMDVEVILAHDYEWFENNLDRFQKTS